MNYYKNWTAAICHQLAMWGYTEAANKVTMLFNNGDPRLYSVYMTSVKSPGIDVMTVKDMIDHI